LIVDEPKEAVMKRIGSLLFLLFLAIAAGTPAGPAPEDPAGMAPSSERLAGLCRLWGLVKFCHPYLATKEIDWDAALIKTLPLVREAASAGDYEKALGSLLDPLGDPLTSIDKRPGSASGPFAAAAAPGGRETPQPFVERTEDGIAVIVANDYRQFSPETTGWAKIIADFKKAFVEAAKSRRVLIDLRNLGGPHSYLLSMAVSDNISWLLDRDILLPPLRYLKYMGYPSQRNRCSIMPSSWSGAAAASGP